MNIVDFSEGILGLDHPLPDGRQARDVVAKCLREVLRRDHPVSIFFPMYRLANDLESGKRASIEVIRRIGERRLNDIKELFEKET